MRFIGKSGKVYNCVATSAPLMTDNSRFRDRSWQKEYYFINDEKITFWFEATWGYYYYFEFNNVWYMSPIFNDRSASRIKQGNKMEPINDEYLYTKNYKKLIKTNQLEIVNS